jgi:hypothetical protein
MEAAELPGERRRSYTRTVWSLAPTTNCHGRAPLQWIELSSMAVLYCRVGKEQHVSAEQPDATVQEGGQPQLQLLLL